MSEQNNKRFIIENEDGLSYQKVVKLYPTEHHCEDPGEKPIIKYSCPVCEACGLVFSFPRGEANCPICGVNLYWEDDGVFNNLSKSDIGCKLAITVDEQTVLAGTIRNVTDDAAFIRCEGSDVVLQYWKKPRFTDDLSGDYPN